MRDAGNLGDPRYDLEVIKRFIAVPAVWANRSCFLGGKPLMLPSERQGFEHYLALYHTPQEASGCQGCCCCCCCCFLMCRGQCPGTAIGSDWRNRSEQCPTWIEIFTEIDASLK